MSGVHALLAPSAAARWVVCAGSVLMEAMHPKPDTQDSREGEASHWAGSEMLSNRPVCVGLVAPNGVTLDEDMIEGAEMYVDHIDEVLQRYGRTRADLVVERRTYMPDIHKENHGTPDCWLYIAEHGMLFVFDYKYGHRFVEVFENWQIMDYANGVMTELGIDGLADQHLTVNLTIVQPRSYHRDGPIRTWSTQAAMLRGHFDILKMAAERALQPGAPCTVNPECYDCAGRHNCEALQKAGYRGMHIAGSATPVDMSPAAVGIELSMLQDAARMIKARMTGLEEQVISFIKTGKSVPGHRMEDSAGREAWSKPVAEVVQLEALFGVKLRKDALITPKQAVKAGLPQDLVAAYSHTPSRGMHLVADDGTKARKIFGK